jgi:hypothetical protein
MEAEGRKPSGPLALPYYRTACAVPLQAHNYALKKH